MKISFNGIHLLKYPCRAARDSVKELEENSPNGQGKFWTSVAIDNDKSSDLLILSGLDLESAIENMDDNQSIDEFVKENADRYIQKAKVYDYR